MTCVIGFLFPATCRKPEQAKTPLAIHYPEFVLERKGGVNLDDRIQKRMVEAIKWFRKAAAQGDRDGQFGMCLAYELGRGGLGCAW